MLKPLGDRIVVKIEEKEQTVGGFVLAGASQEKTKEASVLAIGQGIRTLNGDLVAPAVAVGDTVLIDALCCGVRVSKNSLRVCVL